MAKQCWSQAVLESGSWGHSVLQTPALVDVISSVGGSHFFSSAMTIGSVLML